MLVQCLCADEPGSSSSFLPVQVSVSVQCSLAPVPLLQVCSLEKHHKSTFYLLAGSLLLPLKGKVHSSLSSLVEVSVDLLNIPVVVKTVNLFNPTYLNVFFRNFEKK